jgi:hypothetical protein
MWEGAVDLHPSLVDENVTGQFAWIVDRQCTWTCLQQAAAHSTVPDNIEGARRERIVERGIDPAARCPIEGGLDEPAVSKIKVPAAERGVRSKPKCPRRERAA